MRTTLTLEKDVVAMLKRAEKDSSLSFKDLVNNALRAGLTRTLSKPKAKKRYRTPSTDTGKCLLDSLDNIGEVLEQIEGPAYR